MSSIWRYYNSLTPRSRLLFGGTLITWALAGSWATNAVGKREGWKATEDDKERAWGLVGSPRVVTVERELEREKGKRS